ncbi:hypothetical protein BGZ97_008142 [Linnemannia gamsii]|uniref:Uncharacterized protein n=1 Tax=Linnemannia gamsii TaxID=64522 RepID=A0A9P6R9K5_9FUNG|nr:hypothetical protein BGZ97_008142 [Linnemannia gamsii]
MRQNNTSYGAADGQTFKAIKRVWRNLLRIESDDCFGYAPLPLAYQDEVSAEEGLCVSEKEGMHLPKVDFTKKSHQHRQVSSPSALPRPKTILLASLWAWTMLMTFSAKMGFNSLEQISVPPSSVSSPSSPPMAGAVPYYNVIEQGGGDAPIFILPSDLQPLQVEEQDGQIDLRMWEPTSNIWSAEQQQQGEAIVSLLDMDIDVQFDAIEALWAQGQQAVIHSEEDGEVHPFARIQTSIVLINNNDAASPIEPAFDNMIGDDVEDLSSLDAMIMDPQDEAVFHDFLHQLDQEDAAAALDVSQKEPQDQERLNKLIKATDDLMVASMLDNDLPCSYYRPSTPTWFSGIRQFLVGGSLSTAGSDIGGHFPGRTFIYTGCWDVPAIYFVGIGIAGIILVHAWVPNAALTVYNGDDSNIDEDSSDEDDDTCIGSDTEMDVNNKFSDETPLVWSPPFTERRNACSLDENHRWEVVATATFHEAAGYTR